MSSWDLYHLLIDKAQSNAKLADIMLGISWSIACIDSEELVDTEQRGICFSPQQLSRTLPWAGTLIGRTTNELSEWISHWHPAEAVVGAVTINAVINARAAVLANSTVIENSAPAHLAVFEHFKDQLVAKKVVVVGHYPNLVANPTAASWHCLERNMQSGDSPDTAAEYLLPTADWVFITASSIANKTLPRLLALAKHAQVVLMGPSLPWIQEWQSFGVNYLAGVEVCCAEKLTQVVAQAGGTRIFDQACRYRLAKLD